MALNSLLSLDTDNYKKKNYNFFSLNSLTNICNNNYKIKLKFKLNYIQIINIVWKIPVPNEYPLDLTLIHAKRFYIREGTALLPSLIHCSLQGHLHTSVI